MKNSLLLVLLINCTVSFSQGLHPIKKDLWGYRGTTKKKSIPFQYDFAFPFFEEKAVVIKDGKYGVIDSLGRWIIKPKHDYIDRFQNGIARARKNAKYGYINAQGEWVIEPIWDHLRNFKCGLARSFINSQFGFIDNKGKVVVENKYYDATDFKENRAVVMYGATKTVNYIDKSGELTFKGGFTYLELPTCGYAIAKIRSTSHRNVLGKSVSHNDGLNYYVDTNGNKFSYGQFDSICIVNRYHNKLKNFQEGLALIYNPKLSYCDFYGKTVIEIDYDHACNFHDGLAMVERKNKISFINRSGEQVGKWIKPNDRFNIYEQEKGYFRYNNKKLKSVLSDIYGNVVIISGGGYLSLLTDGILNATVKAPESSDLNNPVFNLRIMGPDLAIIDENNFESANNEKQKAYKELYSNGWFDHFDDLLSKGLDMVKTRDGWLFYEVHPGKSTLKKP